MLRVACVLMMRHGAMPERNFTQYFKCGAVVHGYRRQIANHQCRALLV